MKDRLVLFFVVVLVVKADGRGIPDCSKRVCLSWEQRQYEIMLKCKICKIVNAIEFVSPLGNLVATCNREDFLNTRRTVNCSIEKRFKDYYRINFNYALSDIELSLIKTKNSKVNGNWTCRHGTKGELSTVMISIHLQTKQEGCWWATIAGTGLMCLTITSFVLILFTQTPKSIFTKLDAISQQCRCKPFILVLPGTLGIGGSIVVGGFVTCDFAFLFTIIIGLSCGFGVSIAIYSLKSGSEIRVVTQETHAAIDAESNQPSTSHNSDSTGETGAIDAESNQPSTSHNSDSTGETGAIDAESNQPSTSHNSDCTGETGAIDAEYYKPTTSNNSDSTGETGETQKNGKTCSSYSKNRRTVTSTEDIQLYEDMPLLKDEN